MVEVNPFVEQIVAKDAGVRGELRTHRDKIAARAKADLGAHFDTGSAKVTKSRGSIDQFANLEDAAAGAIEWGGTKKDGTPVPGLHIMRRAMGG